MFFLSCVCYAFLRLCLFVPCGHLLGKGLPLGSRLWCLNLSLSLSHWYPWSVVILDCIDRQRACFPVFFAELVEFLLCRLALFLHFVSDIDMLQPIYGNLFSLYLATKLKFWSKVVIHLRKKDG